MKKHILTLVMILSITGLVMAQKPQAPGKPCQPKPPAMMPFDLTQEQTEKLQDLDLAFEKEMVTFKAQMPAIEAELKAALIADQFSESKVKSLIDKKAKLMSEMELKQLLHQRAIRNLLTPEQQKKFDMDALKKGMGPGPGPRMEQGFEKGPHGKHPGPMGSRPDQPVPPEKEDGAPAEMDK